ncbi:MAG: hypothetical protein AAF191_13100, partial [Verrucomicrobiota bacterium]
RSSPSRRSGPSADPAVAVAGRLAVLVPTTGGVAVIASLAPQPGAKHHFATLKGDFRKLPISSDYAQFAGLADPGASGLHLELTERVETGRPPFFWLSTRPSSYSLSYSPS